MKNIFGTDGVRAKINTSPFTMHDLTKLGRAIGKWLTEKHPNPVLILAQDTRESCDWIKHTLISSLLPFGIHILDAEILPTPAVFHLMKANNNISCGLVISASHNPYLDNGIKLIDAQLGKISAIDELKITDLFYSHTEPETFNFGKYSPMSSAYLDYANAIFSKIHLLNSKKFTVVLDTSNGATYKIAPFIFKKLGIQVHTIHNTPSGKNINNNCGALHIQSLIDKVLNTNADLGFAFDGDGDRIIAVNRFGEIKDGDDILALLLEHPDYKNEKILVGTSMSNQGLSQYCINNGIKFIRTDIGDKYVSQALLQYDALLGGEQSGHIILKDIIPSGDGILVALKILEAIQHTQNNDMITFKKFPQVLLNIKITSRKDLNLEPYNSIIKQAEQKLHVGRLLVRYSGTELILRIMAEAETHELAQIVCKELSTSLEHSL